MTVDIGRNEMGEIRMIVDRRILGADRACWQRTGVGDWHKVYCGHPECATYTAFKEAHGLRYGDAAALGSVIDDVLQGHQLVHRRRAKRAYCPEQAEYERGCLDMLAIARTLLRSAFWPDPTGDV